MARPKKPAGKPKPDDVMQRGIKMTRAYGDWLDRFAAKERVGLSTLIDIALVALAETKGFEPPPERTP